LLPLTETTIRASLINASLRERRTLSLPSHFPGLDWDRIDYFGWRDSKFPTLGYVILELDDGPVGILLRQSSGRIRSRAQCSWCEDVTLPNDVVLFSAKRTHEAGRNGNTIGTLVCAHFECSANVRKRPPVAYIGFDADAARQRRLDSLRNRIRRFGQDLRDGSSQD
jgi:hypothetical protein